MASNVVANYDRQSLPWRGDKLELASLIVVENGPALETFPRDRAHVVQSETGRAHARTAGMHAARRLGCEWFAFWDDDDGEALR